MLYLFAVALLAIGANSQCVPDCTDESWQELFPGQTLECYDYGTVSGSPISTGETCAPPYCGDGSIACSEGTCAFTYCVVDVDTGSITTCSSSEECDTGSACISVASQMVCVEGACNDGEDNCDAGQTCVNNYCITDISSSGCESTSECDEGSACITSGLASTCIEGACNEEADCESGQTCYTAGVYGICTDAATDSDCDCNESDCDCESGATCITYAGVGVCATGVTTCTKSSECSGDTDTCATIYGICYNSCSSNSDCSTGETCQTDPASGLKACDEPDCTADTDCSGTLVCDDEGEGDCVICTETADCTENASYGDGYSCQNYVCIADSCKEDSSACGAYVCTEDGACVICELDGDDCTTGTSCYEVDGVNGCYAYDPDAVNNNEDGINQITTYIAMVIMAMIAVNM